MTNPIYIMSAALALAGMYLLWSHAIRALFLDMARERLFALRAEMYALAAKGEISFDDEAYRSLETLFCGLLRFAHRVTFLTFLLSLISTERAGKDKNYVNVSAQIALRVSRLEPETQQKISVILKSVHDTLVLYVAFSSLLFLSICAVYLVLDLLGIHRLEETKDNVVDALEREAYIAESRRGLTLAVA